MTQEMKAPEVSANTRAQMEILSGTIVTDSLDKLKASLIGHAALRGIAVHELASGSYLVGRWGWARECPDLRTLKRFLEQQGVLA